MPKNSPRETPFIDNSLAIKRTNGDVVSKFLWRSRESIAEIRLNGDRPSEGQVRNEESFEFGQSLEAYNIHLSRNVREIVCKPKPCAFFDAFSSPLIFLFALKLEETQSGAHQKCFRYLIAKMAPKTSARETPFIDNSLAIKRTNGDVISKFLWRSRESIAEIRLNGDRP